jgi:hypothetical protein
MNRRQRRRAKALKVGSVVNIHWGRCTLVRPTPCSLRGEEARPWPWPNGQKEFGSGCAVIEQNDREGEMMVLCEQCWSDDGADIIRQAFGVNLKITDGGYATPEEVAEIAGALAEKQSAVEH